MLEVKDSENTDACEYCGMRQAPPRLSTFLTVLWASGIRAAELSVFAVLEQRDDASGTDMFCRNVTLPGTVVGGLEIMSTSEHLITAVQLRPDHVPRCTFFLANLTKVEYNGVEKTINFIIAVYSDILKM